MQIRAKLTEDYTRKRSILITLSGQVTFHIIVTSLIDLLQKYKEPLPSPLLTKAPVTKEREQDFKCFPPNISGELSRNSYEEVDLNESNRSNDFRTKLIEGNWR
jgi:hypothetical protein